MITRVFFLKVCVFAQDTGSAFEVFVTFLGIFGDCRGDGGGGDDGGGYGGYGDG